MAGKTQTMEELKGDLAALSRRIDGMEEDRRDDAALVRQIASKLGVQVQPDPEGGDEPNLDVPVLCEKCGSKVGYYDAETDLVRTRHREHLVWMRMGPGGSIVIVCRKCSYPVEVTYRPPDDAANAEVRNGLLVLDVAGLTDLLTQAMQSGSGQVTLRLLEAPQR